MTLQQQLSFESNDDEDIAAFNSRLSRVVTKLFGRVMKAEEGGPNPFSPDVLDMEALLCSIEDFLVACNEMKHDSAVNMRDAIDASNDMIKMLVSSIIKAHGGTSYMRGLMNELEIDPQSSTLGSVVCLCEREAEGSESEHFEDAQQEALTVESSKAPPSSTPVKAPSKDVATLVSALASAPQGPDRDGALEALRSYNAAHGEEELNAHLAQVSSPFRSFVEEQIGEDPSGPQKRASASTGGSMSERLRNLRSRLQVTEVAVHNTVEVTPSHQVIPLRRETIVPVSNIPSPTKIPSPPKRASRLSQPSPSKLVRPSPPKIPGIAASSTSQSLRERLAAAQESRKTGSEPTTAAAASTSSGRAAALRARLEAVKKPSYET